MKIIPNTEVLAALKHTVEGQNHGKVYQSKFVGLVTREDLSFIEERCTGRGVRNDFTLSTLESAKILAPPHLIPVVTELQQYFSDSIPVELLNDIEPYDEQTTIVLQEARKQTRGQENDSVQTRDSHFAVESVQTIMRRSGEKPKKGDCKIQ